MSDSDSFNQALDALYKAALASANFIENALTSKDTDFSPADKERLKVALSVLEITWSDEEEDSESDNYDNNGDVF
jgi:transposase